MAICGKFTGLNNTRDLGGIAATDGRRIVYGKLFRSGNLHRATDEDIEILRSYDIGTVFDFRSPEEMEGKPDRTISDEDNVRLQILEDITMGISRDARSDMNALEMVFRNCAANPNFSIEYMEGIYRYFVASGHAAEQYGRFLKAVLEAERPVLWHCTAGKDRAGFATALVLETLGVPKKTIFEDYLLTNEYLMEANRQDIYNMGDLVKLPGMKEAMLLLFSAREEYIGAVYSEAEQRYGSMMGYIKTALHFTDEMIEAMREKYLE